MPKNFEATTPTEAPRFVDPHRERASGIKGLPAKPVPPFILAHYPSNWDFFDGQFVPRVKKIPLVPGVNGHRHGDDSIPRANLIKDGWNILRDVTVTVTGEDGEPKEVPHYMVEHQGYQGPLFLDVWTHPEVIGQGPNAVVDYTHDGEGQRTWLKSLVKNGDVEPIRPAVAKRVAERLGNDAARKLAIPGASAYLVSEGKKLQTKADAAAEAAGTAPKRKPKAKAKAKAEAAA